jgi:hypothetical protein
MIVLKGNKVELASFILTSHNMDTPSVSSQVMPDEMLVDEMPVLEVAPTDVSEVQDVPEAPVVPEAAEAAEAAAAAEAAEVPEVPEVPEPEVPEVPVEDLRRISIYSDNGQESLTLGIYTLADGTQRIILNNLDIPLSDFRGYFRCLTKVEEYHHDDLFFVGIHASFMTGIIVLIVAFGLTLLKTEFPVLGVPLCGL